MYIWFCIYLYTSIYLYIFRIQTNRLVHAIPESFPFSFMIMRSSTRERLSISRKPMMCTSTKPWDIVFCPQSCTASILRLFTKLIRVIGSKRSLMLLVVGHCFGCDLKLKFKELNIYESFFHFSFWLVCLVHL